MFRAKPLALAALLPVFAAPVLAHADSVTATVACIQSVVAAEVPKDKKVAARKDRGSVRGPVATTGRYRIEVVAKTMDSGKELARAVCHANGSGEIVAINGRAPGTSTSTLVTRR